MNTAKTAHAILSQTHTRVHTVVQGNVNPKALVYKSSTIQTESDTDSY